MTQKFAMGSPLYRQEQVLNRQGTHLSRQTISNWILKVSEIYLTPVYEQFHRELLTRDVLHVDETTFMNFLFANTPKGATGSAVMFSLIQTAIENRLDPYKYLTWLMKSVKDANLSQEDTIQTLLPWNAPTECKNRSKE